MEKVRIQDDLYEFVNGEWLEQAVIPDDKPTAGGFADLGVGVEKLMIADLNEMVESGNFPDVYMERACGLYAAAKDVKRRSREGIRPVLKDLKKIKSMTGISSFNRSLKEFILNGMPLPFDISVNDDMKDSNKHCVCLSGPATILPDTVYYGEEMAPQKAALMGLWSNMAAQLLAATRLTEEEQKATLENAIKFDAIIATLVKSREEWSDYVKAYNPTKFRRVSSLIKPVNLRKAAQDIFGFVPDEIIVTDPRFLKGFSTLFNEENFELYKSWAYINTLIDAAPFLSEKLRAIGSSYRNALIGLAQIPSVEKFAYELAGHFYSEPCGLYYGRKYFGEEAKKDVIEMVTEIIETWKKRVAANTILTDATKEKAISKLSTMKVKMGYPDAIQEKYETLVYTPGDSLYSIVNTLSRANREFHISELSKPVDKSRWVMAGHIVNACYNPTANDITFPAAILQAPFYSLKQTRSQNLGGIGAVISHEISHAFDNNGANIDENGNLNNWWTKEDQKKFKKSIQAMIDQYEGIELPWGKVNAKLIVSENVADNGGMACALQVMSGMKDANYEEFFINWAKVWCMKGREEYLKLLLNVDVHGPAVLRANMTVRNFPEWYETFGVTKKDKMYLAPKKRVVIW